MKMETENKDEVLDPQEIKPPSDNLSSKIKVIFGRQSVITLSIAVAIIFGLVAATSIYVLNSQKASNIAKNIPSPTQAPVSPTSVPASPTSTPSPTQAVIIYNTPTPTAVPLTIQIHLLDTSTGNPVSNNGLKATISGQGINKTIENQAEASFELSSPGTYIVTSTDPSGYSANEISCSDNSKCRASTPEFCGMEVSLAQGKIDVYCKYNKSSGSSNSPPPSNNQSVSLSSIDPSSGTVGSSITLRGSGFGTSTGYVIFYNTYGQPSGGAPTDSWSDTEIKARVPGIAPRDTYQVDVENSNGSKSNRASFTVTAG